MLFFPKSMGAFTTWGEWLGDMEWFYSFARDARFNRRPYRKFVWRLLGVLRVILWHAHEQIFRLFVVIANLHDVFELEEDTEE